MSGATLAQTEPAGEQAAGTIEIMGVVEANAVDSITIRADSGGQIKMTFDRETVGALGHPVGSRVEASFHHDQAGTAVADEIESVGGGFAGVAEVRSDETGGYAEPLPGTASRLHLLGLVGLFSISAAALVRATR